MVPLPCYEELMEKPFQYPVPKVRKTRLEQAEARTEQAETRTEQAKTRIEAAETRAEQAETRTESAKTRTEQAETRAEQAETRVEQAEALVEALVGGPSVPMPPATSPADEADIRALGRLTSREREILGLITKGENTKQIAGTLNISPKTVEYHRKKLMDGLGIHDIPGLVRFALRVGLVGLVPASD
jgi:DNA-binding NarL/FixJ family response regulator